MINEEKIKVAIKKYDVDECGGIYNRKTGHQLTPYYGGKRYPKITVVVNGTKKNVYVHRLVAIKYVPNPKNLPVVNHIDCNRENNCKDNLEWCTQSHNIKHSFKSGRTAWNKGKKFK